MTNEQVLNNPTVGQLMDFLSKFNRQKSVILEDPDTGWEISIIHTYEQDDKLYLTGSYGEMKNC
jgi:hypothetical protein